MVVWKLPGINGQDLFMTAPMIHTGHFF